MRTRKLFTTLAALAFMASLAQPALAATTPHKKSHVHHASHKAKAKGKHHGKRHTHKKSSAKAKPAM
jgi:hypothetical protein